VATLHIEHPITDLSTWLNAFVRFAEARRSAGVTNQRIHQPLDDDRYIYVELDFDDVVQAESFKRFLETRVWSSPEASPGLGGTLEHGSCKRSRHRSAEKQASHRCAASGPARGDAWLFDTSS
jgi:hypothetical protein